MTHMVQAHRDLRREPEFTYLDCPFSILIFSCSLPLKTCHPFIPGAIQSSTSLRNPNSILVLRRDTLYQHSTSGLGSFLPVLRGQKVTLSFPLDLNPEVQLEGKTRRTHLHPKEAGLNYWPVPASGHKSQVKSHRTSTAGPLSRVQGGPPRGRFSPSQSLSSAKEQEIQNPPQS